MTGMGNQRGKFGNGSKVTFVGNCDKHRGEGVAASSFGYMPVILHQFQWSKSSMRIDKQEDFCKSTVRDFNKQGTSNKIVLHWIDIQFRM